MNLNGTIKKTQALSGRLVKSSGGGSVQEIYWVQYGVGTATNAEVNEAVAANKLPICYWDSANAYSQTTRNLYYLIKHTPTEALFATVDNINETIIVRRLYADSWSTQTIRYEGKLTWDQTPLFGSQNPVTSGGIYQALQNVSIDIDDALSDTSENAVQNKVVKAALDTKADQASVESTIPPIVNTWLGNNVAQETGYVLDSSLTMSNAAAPADKVGELKSATLDGVETFGLNYKFIRAYITNNGLAPIGYRVSSEDLMVYDRDITVTIAPGFKMGYHKYNSDGTGHVSVGWQTGTYTIPKNQYFRAEIARVTENTSETADIGEFVSKITFTSSLAERFESVTGAVETVENAVNGFANKRVLYSSDSVALSGSGQFVTKDIDVPAEEFGAYYNVLVGSVENVSLEKPVRYRFLDAGGSVINPDKYNAVGVIGTLVSPTNAKTLRMTLYATTSGGLVGNAYFKNVVIWIGNPADSGVESVVSDNIFAQRMTIEGHAFLPDNPLMPSYAHKGYALTAPECTGAAMVEAKRRGYTGVENDTQITSDGEIVMWHDDTLSKLGDSSHGIGDYTLAQLKAKDFGSWKSSKYANERILTFAEWVLLCKNLGLKINVDTKFEWTEAQAAALAQTVIDYGMTDKCVWNINGNGGYSNKLIELIPNATLNYIGTATAERCAILQGLMSEHPGISIQLTPELSQLTAADVARAHSYGIKQFFYTAVDLTSINLESYKAYMDDVLTFGVDGGITDIYRIVDIANMEIL